MPTTVTPHKAVPNGLFAPTMPSNPPTPLKDATKGARVAGLDVSRPALRHHHEDQAVVEADEELGGLPAVQTRRVGDVPKSPIGPSPSVKKAAHGKYVVVRKLLLLALVFTASLSLVVTIFLHLPKVRTLHGKMDDGSEDMELLLKLPKTLEELRAVKRTLELYQNQYSVHVAVGIIILYLFLQTFMIPGSILINMLCGSLYGFYKALTLVTVAAAVGSALCYGLSYYIVKDLVYSFMPEKCDWLSSEVQKHKHNLFFYILFLRITPILPNWFVNVAAPVVSVPIAPFFLGSMFGLIPNGLLSVKAGRTLSKLKSVTDLYDIQTVVTLFLIGGLALVPLYIKRRFERAQHGVGKVV